jgi:hypothetical protein
LDVANRHGHRVFQGLETSEGESYAFFQTSEAFFQPLENGGGSSACPELVDGLGEPCVRTEIAATGVSEVCPCLAIPNIGNPFASLRIINLILPFTC